MDAFGNRAAASEQVPLEEETSALVSLATVILRKAKTGGVSSSVRRTPLPLCVCVCVALHAGGEERKGSFIIQETKHV
jgi:hypothetical protein